MKDKIHYLVEYNSRLLGFTEQDVERIHRNRGLLLSCSDDVVTKIYGRLFEVAETRQIFKEGERAAREQTMRDWFSKTVSSDIDDNYWLWQWLVGALHVRRGVENPMMISMMSVVQAVILKKVISEIGIDEGTELYLSFCRLTNLVVCLVAKSYEDSAFEAIHNAIGMSRKLIETNISLGLDEQIQSVSQELGR